METEKSNYIKIVYNDSVIEGDDVSNKNSSLNEDNMLSNNGQTKLDQRCYEIRNQVFQIGFLDGKNGIKKSDSEIGKMISNICFKYNWSSLSEEYGWVYKHYYDGLLKYRELKELFCLGINNFNPDREFIYRYLAFREGLDPDIKNILESYPDYEYEMQLYNNQMRENENKHK